MNAIKMATHGKQEKEPVNIVHQNAMLCETITKEQRHQKLNTSYNVNPYQKSEPLFSYSYSYL